MDPPPPSRKEHRRRGHDFGQGQGMNSQNENPNNAFHPYGAQGAPRVNADVGIRIYWLPHVKWTLHHPLAKSIDDAATISDRSRA